MFYNKDTNIHTATGPCSGSIAAVETFAINAIGVATVQPVTGGAGAFRGASGTLTRTRIIDPSKCPTATAQFPCHQIDFNLD